MKECDCPRKIVLVGDPTRAFEARETWCPKHGYYNSCYMCETNPMVFSTEKCWKHCSKEYWDEVEEALANGDTSKGIVVPFQGRGLFYK